MDANGQGLDADPQQLNDRIVKAPATLYDLLEVSPHASPPVIRAAYRYLVQFNHPDKRPDVENSNARMATINAAYSILSDAQKRRSYDMTLQRLHPELDRRGSGSTSATTTIAGQCGRPEVSRPFVFRSLH